MRLPHRHLILALVLQPFALAQLQDGDLLISRWSPPELTHLRSDGSVVTQIFGPPGDNWAGSTVTPEGNWITATFHRELLVFDPSGTQIGSFPMTEINGPPGEPVLFADGTLVVGDQGGDKMEM
ncbi:MAG: hypothetical protein GY711_09315 [bacterium]|nr:hypothetical protein [bacterium]